MNKNYIIILMCLVLPFSFIYVAYKTLAERNQFNPLNAFFQAHIFEKRSDRSEINIVGTNDGFVAMEEYVKGPLQENDPRITSFILSHGFIHPPPSPKTPYNLTTPKYIDPSKGQSQVKNGFFVECGALDGETRSNTLALERDYNWTGLLIEGSPSNFELIKTKNRKAWTANCCLAVHPYPHEVTFREEFNIGKISLDGPSKSKANKTANEVTNLASVQCYPIFSLLSAINVTTVDYFSLDVEGDELKVLRTIPFDLVYIKVLSVEFVHVDIVGVGGEDWLKTFMESKNYSVVEKVVARNNWANDLIFVHKNFNAAGKFPKKIYS